MSVDALGFLTPIGSVKTAAAILGVLHWMTAFIKALLRWPLARKYLVDATKKLLIPHRLFLSDSSLR